jgi:anti-anti-sigma factor
MAPQPFSASIRAVAGSAILDLRGEINSQAEQALNQAYTQATVDNPASVVLNFTNVGYINSTGIALIVGLLAQARKVRRPLNVYGLSEHYLEIFQITRLADFMGVFDSEAAALADDGQGR